MLESTNLLSVLGILALAVAVVVLLLRFMRARNAAYDRRDVQAEPQASRAQAPLTKEEEDYLDSSHISGPIVPGGRDALETWRNNKRQ